MSTSFGGKRYPSANAATYARTQRAHEYAAQQRARNAVMGDRAALAGLPGALGSKVRGYPKGGSASATKKAAGEQAAARTGGGLTQQEVERISQEIQHAADRARIATIQGIWNKPISAGDLRQLYHYTTDAQVATHLAKFPAADLRAGVRAMGIAPARTKAGMVDQLMGRTTNEQAPSTRATGSRGGSAKKAAGEQAAARTGGGRRGANSNSSRTRSLEAIEADRQTTMHSMISSSRGELRQHEARLDQLNQEYRNSTAQLDKSATGIQRPGGKSGSGSYKTKGSIPKAGETVWGVDSFHKANLGTVVHVNRDGNYEVRHGSGRTTHYSPDKLFDHKPVYTRTTQGYWGEQ